MKREIRSGLIAGMAGTGAVIDVGSETFVVPGIDKWRQSDLRVIELKRLSRRLRKILKGPKEKNPCLQVKRFPRAMFCERCRKLILWQTSFEREDSEPTCPHAACTGRLVAMRFVVACENGHVDDVDWRYWAHSGRNGDKSCRHRDQLSFIVDPSASTGGLGSLRARCDKCNSSRSLEDLSNKTLVKEIFSRCSGSHPWIFGHRDECDADVVVLQRGATNLHYPITISALDIPVEVVESEASQFADQVKEHKKYGRLTSLLTSAEGNAQELVDTFAELIGESIGCSLATVLEVAMADVEGRPISGAASSEGELDQEILLQEEWRTIESSLLAGELLGPNFTASSEKLAASSPQWMRRLFNGILLIHRLREVRAYRGFQRVKPAGQDKIVPPDVGGNQSWLPASEVFGEGMVLALDFNTLKAWADQIPSDQQAKIQELEQKRLEENYYFLPSVDPIFLAIHTLSHLLIRRITFECGYSSSSLRERLYFSREHSHAGIMIYTADGDSEGSLGGLVRQGREDRLAQSLIEAIGQGRWCSSDPVCSETAGQGLGGFNRSACHACSLVSETSCTMANTLLDRQMLFAENWGLLSFLGEKG